MEVIGNSWEGRGGNRRSHWAEEQVSENSDDQLQTANLMNVKRLTTRVTTHRLFVFQFLGFSGSDGPSQVTSVDSNSDGEVEVGRDFSLVEDDDGDTDSSKPFSASRKVLDDEGRPSSVCKAREVILPECQIPVVGAKVSD